jgi:hypothetical protein
MQAVAGLSERELSRVRGRLVEFTGEVFESMRRTDQRLGRGVRAGVDVGWQAGCERTVAIVCRL